MHLAAVAAVYREALRLGLPPSRTVAEHWGHLPDHTSVSRWIRAARDRSFLGTRDDEAERYGDDHAKRHHKGQCESERRRRDFREEVDQLVPRGELSDGTREWRPTRRHQGRATWPVVDRSTLSQALSICQELRQRAVDTGRQVADQFVVESPESGQATAYRKCYNPDGTVTQQIAVIDSSRIRTR
ncbi:hypothetical protein ACFVVX_15610 [Kitasatospora sp. NPDC058170]|uniref:hypothetical protein n=1 Tax=Kitasatospora sp. NPDC058170 TaxID=3346364 RepID=UPI0036DF9D7A